MKNPKIGKRTIDISGVWQLVRNLDAEGKRKFSVTNIDAFVPKGKTIEDKRQFMTESGLRDTLFIDKVMKNYSSENEIEAHNIAVLLEHPQVYIGGYTPEQHQELYNMGLKVSNPKFTLTNLDKKKDEEYEDTGNLLMSRVKLYDTKNPLSNDVLVFLASGLGVAWSTKIKDREQFRKFLVRQIDSAISSKEDIRIEFDNMVDNIKITELTFYISQMMERQIIVEYAGIYKLGEKPLGVGMKQIMEFFERNPEIFEHHKKQIIAELKEEKIIE